MAAGRPRACRRRGRRTWRAPTPTTAQRSTASRRLSGRSPTSSASAVPAANGSAPVSMPSSPAATIAARTRYGLPSAPGIRYSTLRERPCPQTRNGRRPALGAEVERRRHEVGRVEPLVGVHVRAGQQHELGRAAHDPADELPAEPPTGRSRRDRTGSRRPGRRRTGGCARTSPSRPARGAP